MSWSAIALGQAAILTRKPWAPVLLAPAHLVWYYFRIILKPSISSGSQDRTSSLLNWLALYGLVTVAGLVFIYFGENSAARILSCMTLAALLLYFVWDDFRNAKNLQKRTDKE